MAGAQQVILFHLFEILFMMAASRILENNISFLFLGSVSKIVAL
jgi:hypothetical protein